MYLQIAGRREDCQIGMLASCCQLPRTLPVCYQTERSMRRDHVSEESRQDATRRDNVRFQAYSF
jgi:hypothetical protein